MIIKDKPLRKIVFWGVGNTFRLAIKFMDHSSNIVVALIDNNKEMYGKQICDLTVSPPDILGNVEFDVIIITVGDYVSVFKQLISMGILINKILIFNEEYFKLNKENFFKKEDHVDVLFSGISYANCLKLRNLSYANISAGSQDIFFDSVLTRVFMKRRKIKFFCHVLSQYSLEYNLLYSTNYSLVTRYHFLGKTFAEELKTVCPKYAKLFNKRIAKSKIIKKYNPNIAFHDIFNYSELSVEDELLFADTAKLHSNKNYPETVYENKKIVEDLVVFCLENNVTPILLTLPQHKIYRENFSERIYLEFIKFIQYLQNRYNIQYINSYCDDYEKQLFFDGDHLNFKGYQIYCNTLENRLIDIRRTIGV